MTIKGNGLYSFSEDCGHLQHDCSKNVNRILEKMVQHHDCCDLLERFTKECMVLSKFCEYLCHSCCNSECISSHCLKELKSKAKQIKKTCAQIMKKMPKNDCMYIRCHTIPKLCDKVCKY